MDQGILDDLQRRRAVAREMGGEAALGKLAHAGKLDARSRVAHLLDAATFQELGIQARSQHPDLRDRTPADGLIAGSGLVDGRIVYVVAEDASVVAGTRGRVAETKIARIRELALAHKKPFVALTEAGAGRFQESNGAISAGMGVRFREHYELSGVVPQVAGLMGPCFGGPSFTAAQSDFITITRRTGFMGMSGPAVVKIGIGQEATAEEIGGAEAAAASRGMADHLAGTDEEAIGAIREFLSYFPSHSGELPPVREPRPAPIDTPEGRAEIVGLVSENHRRAYDMRKLLRLIADEGRLFPYKQLYGPNLLTAWMRIDGRSVGVLANQPMQMAGALDEKAAVKARRFVDICDAFHIPVVFLVDCPGFLVGPAMEDQRMVVLASQMLTSVMSATVPKVTIVLRKAIGLAYVALGGRACRPDRLVSWPTGRFDVMGTAAGVELVHGRDIARSEDPARRRAEILAEVEAQSSAYLAAEMGLIDDVIHPIETREVIRDSLAKASGKSVPGFKRRIMP